MSHREASHAHHPSAAGADGDRRHRTVIDRAHGKPSTTSFRVLERLGNYTLIEARPKTGRPHQIRAHLAAERLPLVGDVLYASQGGGLQGDAGIALRRLLVDDAPLARLGLHADVDARTSCEWCSRDVRGPLSAGFAEALAGLGAIEPQRRRGESPAIRTAPAIRAARDPGASRAVFRQQTHATLFFVFFRALAPSW